MKMTLIMTTALATLVTAGAYAQSDMADQPKPPSSIFQSDETAKPLESNGGFFSANPNEILATSLLGQTIYNGTGEDAVAVGNVNDVVMAPSGSAEAVVIGVGGFLGIGEKEVAVAFDNVQVFEKDGQPWLTIDADKPDLEQAPAFDRSVFQSSEETQVAAGADENASPDADMTADTAADTGMNGEASDRPMDIAGNGEDRAGLPAGDQDMTKVDLKAISAEKLIGARVYANNDADIGEIGDVILSDDGTVESYIVDVGGFLGIGEKQVALAATELDIYQNGDGWLSVETPFTKQQLQDQPAYDPESYQQAPDTIVLQ